jgi:hypothetical protein
MKLITPTFEESAHFHNPAIHTSHCAATAFQGAPYYEDLASNSIQGVAHKAHGDSDRHNLEYQECEAHPHAMLVVGSDLSDANMLQTPPMCYEDVLNTAFSRYQRKLLMEQRSKSVSNAGGTFADRQKENKKQAISS